MKEKYTVPQELIELHTEALSAEEARDVAVRHSYFKFQLRNAIYLGTIAIKKRNEFWDNIRELYPDLKEDRLIYNQKDQTVSIKAD